MTKQLTVSKIENGKVVEVKEINPLGTWEQYVLRASAVFSLWDEAEASLKSHPVRGTEDEEKLAEQFADEFILKEQQVSRPYGYTDSQIALWRGLKEGYKAAALKAPKGNQRVVDVEKLGNAYVEKMRGTPKDTRVAYMNGYSDALNSQTTEPIEQTGFSEHRIGDVVMCEIDEQSETAKIIEP